MKTLTSLHTGRKGESSIPDLSWGNKFWTKRSKQYVRQIPENFVLSARDNKVFIDLVTLSETVRKNSYLFTLQDRFTRFTSAYLICNKEAGTVARVLIREHFSVFGLQNQIHKSWRYCIPRSHHTIHHQILRRDGIMDILRTMGRGWMGSGCKSCLSSLKYTDAIFCHVQMEATLSVNWIYPIPKAQREMELSDWTEVMQERFQRAYAGMREKQKSTVRLNAQY